MAADRPAESIAFALGNDGEDLQHALMPLSRVSRRIAADLIAGGNGHQCGDCGKPFNAARKYRAVVRLVTVTTTGMVASYALICGKCKAAAEGRQRAGGSYASEQLRDAALQVHEAGALAAMPARGRA